MKECTAATFNLCAMFTLLKKTQRAVLLIAAAFALDSYGQCDVDLSPHGFLYKSDGTVVCDSVLPGTGEGGVVPIVVRASLVDLKGRKKVALHIPLLESRAVMLDDVTTQVFFPDGGARIFKGNSGDAAWRMNAQSKGSINLESACGNKLLFKKGRLAQLRLKEGVVIDVANDSSAVIVKQNNRERVRFLEGADGFCTITVAKTGRTYLLTPTSLTEGASIGGEVLIEIGNREGRGYLLNKSPRKEVIWDESTGRLAKVDGQEYKYETIGGATFFQLPLVGGRFTIIPLFNSKLTAVMPSENSRHITVTEKGGLGQLRSASLYDKDKRLLSSITFIRDENGKVLRKIQQKLQ